ncbi:MAG: hypothetical protein N3E50_07405 [Candidatus Goldbacteria bacterium]|nr:hypothetical protein [Candidatus Goldiibacteriota bacterium]
MTLGMTPKILSDCIKRKIFKKIIVICTKKSQKKLETEDLKNLSRQYKVKIIYELIEDENNPDITFTKADEIIKSLLNKKISPEDIHVNYTGGTKSMSLALGYAGIANNIRNQIYIAGERDENHKVKSGYEEFRFLSLPRMFLTKNFNIIKSLFNNEDFNSVLKYIEYTEHELNIKKESDDFFNFLYEINNAYLLWDRMEYEKAAEKINNIKPDKKIIENLQNNFIEQLNKNKMILNKTAKFDFFKILDKYAAAMRYFEKGYYLIVAEMLYSLAEFIADYILKEEYKLNKQNIDENLARELISKAGKTIPDDYFNTSRSKSDGKIHLPLYHSYDLLFLLGNEIGKIFINDKEYLGAIKIRNDAIHSNKPVSKEDAERFLIVTNKFLKEFCKKYSVDKIKDLDELIKNYKYVKL